VICREKRIFACTGFFIEWNGSNTVLTSASLVRSSSDENKTDENLRVCVLLDCSLIVALLYLRY